NFERQLVDADHVAIPLGYLVEGNDGRHFSRSSDLIEKFRMHAEIPARPTNTAADQYQGYFGPPNVSIKNSRWLSGRSLLNLSQTASVPKSSWPTRSRLAL